MTDHDHGPTAQLLDPVWCETCHHDHVATIPAVTFRCADCGFGCWGHSVAAAHADTLPEHVVHPVVHRIVESHAEPAAREAVVLLAAADAWMWGGWADTPRHADRVADRMAASQYAGEWLRARAAALTDTDQEDR